MRTTRRPRTASARGGPTSDIWVGRTAWPWHGYTNGCLLTNMTCWLNRLVFKLLNIFTSRPSRLHKVKWKSVCDLILHVDPKVHWVAPSLPAGGGGGGVRKLCFPWLQPMRLTTMGLLNGDGALMKTDGALDDALDDNEGVLERKRGFQGGGGGGGLQTSVKLLKLRVRPPNRLMVVGPMALRPLETGSEGSGGPPKRHHHSLSLSNDELLSSAAVLTA